MMMNDELRVVTLEELKLQMHEDFEDEDAIITTYGIIWHCSGRCCH